MDYTFKKYKLSDVEKIWLGELYNYNFTPINVKSLKVELWDQLPKNFDPKSINRRFTIDNRLTLLGIWYFDQNNKMFEYVSRVITSLRYSIIGYPAIKGISAIDISNKTDITVRDIEIAIELIYDFGGFFSGAAYSDEKSGLKSVSFGDGYDAYDRFLNYECIDDLLESHFVQNTPSPFTDTDLSTLHSKPELQAPETIVWDKIEKEYHISKRTFGKKINFIKDKYKRSIIFRDVEHAYTLAKFGYCKPAAILAGGVIEELLRLYLKQKDIKPQGRGTFEDIIKTCQSNSLFQNAITPLSESVRYFRNVVHLAREKTKKDAVSMSAAQGVVASIFTIVNDF